MEIKNIVATKLSEETISLFLESLKGKYGFFDMYYNYGPCDCFCTDEYLAVIISQSNYSDARGGGGIERNNSISLYNHKLEKVASSAEVNYRHRSSDRYDNYYNQYVEILEVIKKGDSLSVMVKTGKGTIATVDLAVEEKSK